MEVNTKVKTVFKPSVLWPELIAQIFVHTGSLLGFYYWFTLQAQLYTFLWFIVVVFASGIGITAGAHRLWTHKSYKAKLPLRVMLVFFCTIAAQNDIYRWVKDHRVHHKYSDTNADPHNAKRGFFFSHVGWIFLTPHPDVVEKRMSIDMSDMQADKLIMWQKTYYTPLFIFITVLFPVLVPYYFWNEKLWIAFWTCFACRLSTTLNVTYSVNSVAHMFGVKPYDKTILPVENFLVSFAALGEGFHNYHHVFPFDYKTGEFGGWKGYQCNFTTAFIDFAAKLGLAYDRKSATPEMIAKRAERTGDESCFKFHEESHETWIWGYGDKDMGFDELNILDRMNN